MLTPRKLLLSGSSKLYELNWYAVPGADEKPQCQCIVWAAEESRFVALASKLVDDRAWTSLDGIIWTGHPTDASMDRNWKAIAYSPSLGVYVAVNNNDTDEQAAYSTNGGETWSIRTVPARSKWSSVCWSPELNMFVAVGSDWDFFFFYDRIMTSPNGVDWTLRTPPSGERKWTRVIWVPELSRFVAIGIGNNGEGEVMTSEDGITWTLRSTPHQASWQGLAWSPEHSELVAVASGSLTNAKIMKSSDGITWTTYGPSSKIYPATLAWSPEFDLFYVVGSDNYAGNPWAMSIPGGVDSTQTRSAGPMQSYTSIAWSPVLSRFVAVGIGNDAELDPFMIIEMVEVT